VAPSAIVGVSRRQPRRAAIILVAVLAAAAATTAYIGWKPVLRSVGWAIVANESVAPADIIIIAPETAGAGALEAADLVQSGIATRVAVFLDPPTGPDHEFIRRGLPYDDWGERQVWQLGLLGVTNVLRVPREIAGTRGTGQVLQAWCDQYGFRSVIFVTVRDHSRRLRRVLDREMRGHPRKIKIVVHPARYSSFDPDRWWESRTSARIVIIELQKLVLDFVLHPISF
jgi:hypothetical protein